MKTAIKIFEFAVAVFLTAFLVSMAFGYFNKGSALNDKADKKVTNITNEISVSDITKYDGRKDLNGADVLAAIKHFEQESICINVNNGRSNTTYIMQSDLTTRASGVYSEASNIASANTYINPSSVYGAVVDYDGGSAEAGNGSIIGITFTKIR